jgi:hypothetical protein
MSESNGAAPFPLLPVKLASKERLWELATVVEPTASATREHLPITTVC